MDIHPCICDLSKAQPVETHLDTCVCVLGRSMRIRFGRAKYDVRAVWVLEMHSVNAKSMGGKNGSLNNRTINAIGLDSALAE